MNLAQDFMNLRSKGLKKAHTFFLSNMDFTKEDFTK